MMRWLDQVTGRVTMYRLVLICLLALVAETVLLGLIGLIPGSTPPIAQNPFAILVSGAVLVAVSYGSSRLFGLLFKVKPHSESSLITGLLLLFIFEPTLNPLALTGLVLAAVIANASKYLLAWHGRHIFNPAAVGAFVVALITPFGDFGAWWLATGWLLPLTLVLGFVVLYRTRRLPMAGVFVIVVFFITLWYYGGDFPVGQTLLLPFTTFATIFFAAFMLSEPLTLPPRRSQQLIEAVVVAVIFSVPLHIGLFSFTTPQFALLVGNAVAFAFGQRRGIRLDFLGSEQLTSTSRELSFRPQRPIKYQPGQFMELTIPHSGADVRGLRRTFSIASAPVEADVIRFGIRTAERSSSFKTALLDLKPGETVTATAVGGDFLLPRDDERLLLLVASGIGITPYMSHLSHLTGTSQKRDIVLVYSASSADELAYADRLKDLDVRVLVVAPTEPTKLPEHWSYLGPGPVTAALITEAVPDARNRATYISGPPSLVHALRPALRKAHVHSIKTDYFSGY